jgi:hypothetical protein
MEIHRQIWLLGPGLFDQARVCCGKTGGMSTR